MGDVVLVVPVLQAVLEQNSGVRLTILTRKAFIPLFQGVEAEFVIPDLYGRHKGALGLFRLYKELKVKAKWDVIIDLHNVLRSKILRTYFKFNNVPCFALDKGRKEKKQLVAKKNKALVQLKHSCERSADVWRKAGFSIDLSKIQINRDQFVLSEETDRSIGEKEDKWIGIAPFAQHAQKMYPIEMMTELIRQLDTKGYRIFIFGGGKTEKKMAEELSTGQSYVINLIGRFALSDELALLSKMDLMLSMDSSNMHMAALTGTKVISIWGATHPYAGFTAFGQSDEEQLIQIPTKELSCRPCSVFGNKPCHRGDFACMNNIQPDAVIDRIESFLK